MNPIQISISIASAFLCIGCASSAAPIIADDEMAHMSRQEVINAIQECQENDTHPVVIYARDKWRKNSVVVPIDVQCTPIPYRYHISLPQRRRAIND